MTRDVRQQAIDNQTYASEVCELSHLPTYIGKQAHYLDGHKICRGGCETDSRKSNLYKAENRITQGPPMKTVDEMQDYVDHLTSLRWFERRWGKGWTVEVMPGRGCRSALAHRTGIRSRHGRIKMPKHARWQRCVLHEVAHLLIPPPHAGHGRLYCRIFLELVEHEMGDDVGETLKEKYREYNVKWHPHHSIKV